MDAAQALADLTEISSQVVSVAIIAEGAPLASTFSDRDEEKRFAEGVVRLLAEADRVVEARGLPSLLQLEAATVDGSVFVVRREGRLIAATTRPDPTVGLVFYDLKHCLGSVEEPEPAPAPRRRSRAKADPEGGDAQG